MHAGSVPVLKPEKEDKKEAGLLKKLLRNRLAAAGLVVILFMVIIAVFAPWIATHPPNK
ncbi:MAG: hypothetical protein CW346_19845, partial [Bacillaceae bacterium]|nr:hypothetical protein [Bacillaceae bacterium]